MATTDKQTSGTVEVTDTEIQDIMDRAEAGISDLITAYEPIERHYFQAVNTQAPVVTYAIDTNPR